MKYVSFLFLFICMALYSCSVSKSVYILTEDVQVETNSSCRNTAISNYSNNPKLKAIQLQSIKEQSEEQHIKTANNKEEAKYKIKNSKIVITEKCGNQNNSQKPSYNLAQILIFENTMTQQVVEFKSDTTVVTKQELSNIQSLANSTPSFEIFLPALTKKNVSLLKLYLDKEK